MQTRLPNPYRLPLKAYGAGELHDIITACTAELATRVVVALGGPSKPA